VLPFIGSRLKQAALEVQEYVRLDLATLYALFTRPRYTHDIVEQFDVIGVGSLTVVLLTGRPLRVRPQTLAWLNRYKLRWDLLIMRHWGDYSAAREFKQDTVAELRDAGFDLRLAFEDDRRNVEMFRAEGIPCLYVHSGYYD